MLGEIKKSGLTYSKPLQNINFGKENSVFSEDADSFTQTSTGKDENIKLMDNLKSQTLKESTELNWEVKEELVNLEKLGVKCSEPDKILTNKERLQIMKSMQYVMSKIPDNVRPKELSVTIKPRDDIKGTATGRYFPKDKHLEIYVYDNNGVKRSVGKLLSTAAHEYGHSVSDSMKHDNPQDFNDPFYALMSDSQGRNLTDRSIELENKTKLQGHMPDDPINEDTVYDRFDPYVLSHKWETERGTQEKYARKNPREHFAESFKDYIIRPKSFKSKIEQMEEYLETNGTGTEKYNKEEYDYVSESLDIMKNIYGYFKTQVFNGYEFIGDKNKIR
jgi:hypothetical protein